MTFEPADVPAHQRPRFSPLLPMAKPIATPTASQRAKSSLSATNPTTAPTAAPMATQTARRAPLGHFLSFIPRLPSTGEGDSAVWRGFRESAMTFVPTTGATRCAAVNRCSGRTQTHRAGLRQSPVDERPSYCRPRRGTGQSGSTGRAPAEFAEAPSDAVGPKWMSFEPRDASAGAASGAEACV